MSYGVQVYLVNTQQLMADIKKDSSLLNVLKHLFLGAEGYRNSLIRRCSYIFPDIDELMRMVVPSNRQDEVNAAILMWELLHGSSNRKEYAPFYMQVFQVLCHQIGDAMPNHAWYPCSSSDFYNLPFASSTLPFEVPENHDFPAVSCIKYSDIRLDALDHQGLDPEQIEQLTHWLQEAIDYQLDIFLFYG